MDGLPAYWSLSRHCQVQLLITRVLLTIVLFNEHFKRCKGVRCLPVTPELAAAESFRRQFLHAFCINAFNFKIILGCSKLYFF